MLKNLPILFFVNKDNSNFSNNYFYKVYNIKSLLKKYNFNKNEYFMFYYSDFYLLDSDFLLECLSNNSKVLKFLEKNKNFFLFSYYNNKFYNFNSLLKFIKLYSLKFNKVFYFLNLKQKNKKLLTILFYLKNKKCLV